MNLKKILSDSSVEKRYVMSGGTFGYAVSYLAMGECLGFKQLLDKWADWEKEYSRRGYRTISIDRFIGLGGYNKSVEDIIGKKRKKGEKAKLHAEIYRQTFLGKIAPLIDFGKMVEDAKKHPKAPPKPQFGTYFLPSTENEKKKN